ncbi:unnamed protein product [Rotaria sordida]|uniref:SGNH hydrolase-type esterase domain-containing protein n=1 Tax=Rotaria sordida TaxID=392033 RepID=A0A815SLA0_9BILA|nr:unnamed protein product [Rotaria sordida]
MGLPVCMKNSFEAGELLVGLGDSFTSAGDAGGLSKSYPIIAGGLLNWQARNFAKGGAKMSQIPAQLAAAASSLSNATHVVFTIGGNDLGVADSLIQIILKNNFTAVIQKATNLKPRLVSTYKLIQAAVRPQTKIYAVPYVDFISVGNKIPNEADCHRMMDVLTSTIQDAAAEAKIGFIGAVKLAFLGHEMFSADPYVDSFLSQKNAAHPNAKGYAKIGQVCDDDDCSQNIGSTISQRSSTQQEYNSRHHLTGTRFSDSKLLYFAAVTTIPSPEQFSPVDYKGQNLFEDFDMNYTPTMFLCKLVRRLYTTEEIEERVVHDDRMTAIKKAVRIAYYPDEQVKFNLFWGTEAHLSLQGQRRAQKSRTRKRERVNGNHLDNHPIENNNI